MGRCRSGKAGHRVRGFEGLTNERACAEGVYFYSA